MKIEFKINIGFKEMRGYILSKNPNLDEVCEAAQAIEILGDEILNYIPVKHLGQLIQHWRSKLRIGGRLILGGTDLIEMAKAIVTKQTNPYIANQVLFGIDCDRVSCLTLDDIENLVRAQDLKIISKRLDGINFLIEAVRQ